MRTYREDVRQQNLNITLQSLDSQSMNLEILRQSRNSLDRPVHFSFSLERGGRLLTFPTYRVGAYARWDLLQCLAVNRTNTVVTNEK